MTQTDVRVGIIGAGHWGWNLIRVCHDLGALAAVCDSSPTMLARVAEAYPSTLRFSEVDEFLLQRLDAVFIAAPAQLHAQLALQVLAAGKHVFVEKPFALTVPDAEAIAGAAAATGLQVFAGHLLIYHPAVKKLRKIIQAGDIGRVWHLRSRRLSLGKLRHHESVWWSFAPHDVSLMLALMNEEPSHVVGAQAGWLTSRTPDAAYADYQFAHGRSAHIEVSWLDPNKMWQFDVFGTDGVITITETPGKSRMTLAKCGARSDEHGHLSTWRGAETEVQFERVEPLREEVVAFFTSLRFGIAAETDATEGLSVVRALALADRASHHSGNNEARL
jgi:UDP-2-acetamido-3-amino-2,3-dideoxy-glucuronate N-acetyltransferase